MTFLHRTIAATIGVLLTGCTINQKNDNNSQLTIRGGQATDEHPAVVAIVTNKTYRCTGTLIAPRIVLTSANCAKMARNQGGAFVASGEDVRRPTESISVRAFGWHKYYDTGILNQYIHDIGVLVLDREMTGVQPIPYWGLAMDDTMKDVRYVGYGGYANNAGDNSGSGIKRYRDASLTTVGDQFLSRGGILRSDGQIGPHTLDEGAPVLMKLLGQWTVVGVMSHVKTVETRFITQSVATRLGNYGRLLDELVRSISPNRIPKGSSFTFNGNCN